MRSKTVILMMVLSACWLLTQLVIPFENSLITKLMMESCCATPPDWFMPELGWSIAPSRGLKLALSEVFLLLVFVVSVSIVDTRTRVRQFLIVLSIVCLIHVSIALLALYSGVHLVEQKQLDGHWHAARGIFVNRNHFASLIVLCLFGSLAYLFYICTKLSRDQATFGSIRAYSLVVSLSLICLVVGMIALIESQSRGALLGLIVGVLLYGNLHRNVIASSVFIALGSVVLFVFGGELLERLTQGFLSFGERGQQWRITLEAIADSPLYGFGGGSYAAVFQIYRGQVDLRDVLFSQAHNLYLHIWLERGLVGLGLWITTLVLTYRKLHSAIQKCKSTFVKSTLRAGGVLLTAALLQAFVDYNLQILSIKYLFYCILGLMFAAPVVQQSRIHKEYS